MEHLVEHEEILEENYDVNSVSETYGLHDVKKTDQEAESKIYYLEDDEDEEELEEVICTE